MTEKKSFAPGEFCWIELTSPDWKAAAEFYGSLFGWTTNAMPMGPNEPPYVMLQSRGKTAGALYENKKVKPAWLPYIAVASADDAARKAKSLGAKLQQEPFEVMDAGRMTNVEDPQGAKFAIWEGKGNKGVEVINEPNALCWTELYTNDIERARKFYSGLFGSWKLKASPEYTEIHLSNGDPGIGGMMQMSPEMKGMTPDWIPYFAVTDCDALAKKAKSLGAHVGVEPTDIPNVGRFSVLADPAGARFAIIKLG